MKKLLWCLLFVNFSMFAGKIEWHDGSVVLQSGEVMVGKLSVNTLHNLVLVERNSGSVDVFPAHRIESVRYYDPINNINRKYLGFKINDSPAVAFRLMEVVVSGQITLVRQQRNSLSLAIASDKDDFDYYLLYRNDIVPLRKFQSTIFPRLEKADTVREFILSHNLDVNEPADIVVIVERYNKLCRDHAFASVM